MKKILIFGAGGFVGRTMLEYLESNAGCQIIKVFHKWNTASQEKCIYADITDQSEINRIIVSVKPDQIVNLTGIHSMDECLSPNMMIDVNVRGTINILESVKKSQLDCKVLVIGSSEQYAPSNCALDEQCLLKPRGIYGMTKLWQEMAAEWYFKEYGIKVICVRPFNHTGIYQSDKAVVASFCKQIAQIERGESEPVLFVGNLNIERDISDVRDIVRAYKMLLDSDIKYGIYNVCSGKKIKLYELVDKILSFASKKIQIMSDIQRIRTNDIPVIYGDNMKIRQAVDWTPQIDFDSTLREISDYHLNQ